MTNKLRTKPLQLKILEQLKKRQQLSNEDLSYLTSLKKGYEGELQFDGMLEELKCDHIILSDLVLEVNRQTFQIDSLIITGERVYLYEIKNYQGEYIYENNEIKTLSSNKVIVKPSTQIDKTRSLLNMLLYQLDYDITVCAYVVFVNHEFLLYQASPNPTFILFPKIKKHIEQLNLIDVPLKFEHERLAVKLTELHVTDNRFIKLPEYHYKELKKEVTCPNCQFNLIALTERTTHCLKCNYSEANTEIMFREIREFQLLFPNIRLTTHIIYDWCGKLYSKDSIRRNLKKNFEEIGKKKGKYYE